MATSPARTALALLGDQPDSAGDDPLEFSRKAADLCALILASRDSTPFTLGIEAGWGMGKSSLMERLRARLVATAPDDVRTIEFNVWAADEGTILEGLFKTILDAIGDLEALERAERWRKRIKATVRGTAEALKLGDVVDAVWEEMASDPRARNALRDLVKVYVGNWREGHEERVACVFVDDLDRCAPAVVFEVFEAIKLYLAAPGLVFIVGYDPDIVSEAILEDKQYSKTVRSREYLEKIVQVSYRIPRAGSSQIDELVQRCLATAGIEHPLDDAIRSLIAERNARNPRRIKRFLNSLVLAYRHHPEWADLDQEVLIRWQLLQSYFPQFAQLLGEVDDPIGLFSAYVEGAQLGAVDARIEDVFETLKADGEFRSLIEPLGSSEARETLHQFEERRSAGLRAEVADAAARRVLEALLDPRWEFRTVRGLAKASRLTEEEVTAILDEQQELVRQSPIPNAAGEELFAARSALRALQSA